MQTRGVPRGSVAGVIALVLLLLMAGSSLLLETEGSEVAPVAAPTPPERSTADHLAKPVQSEAPQSRQRPPDSPALAQLVAAPDADLTLPYEFRLALLVTDAFGLPVPDTRLFVAPPGGAFGAHVETTDAHGRLSFSCRARTQRIELWCAVLSRGVLEWMELLELEEDSPRLLHVTAHSELIDSKRLEQLIERGYGPEQLAAMAERDRFEDRRRGRMRRRDKYDVLCGRMLMLFEQMPCHACHSESLTMNYAPFTFASGLVGHAHRDARFSALRNVPPSESDRVQRRDPIQPADDLAWRRRLSGQSQMQTVKGRVRANDGTAPGPVPVAWLADDGALIYRAMTDVHGNFDVVVAPDELVRLRVGGGASGLKEQTLVVPRGSTTGLELDLDLPPLLRGTAVDEAGNPLVKWRVTFHGASEPYAALAWTDDEGRFAIPADVTIGHCLLWPDADDLHLPVVRSSDVLLGSTEVSMQLPSEPPTRARLRLSPLLPASHRKARVEMRLVQMATGMATHLSRTGRDEQFEIGGLAAGHYRGEVGAPMLGWVKFGPVHLDGRGVWDCGTIAFPQPGTARFRLDLLAKHGSHAIDYSPFAGEFAFYRQDESHDIRQPTRKIDVNEEAPVVELPAGDYALVWRRAGDPEEEPRSVAFRVLSGRETGVVIPE